MINPAGRWAVILCAVCGRRLSRYSQPERPMIVYGWDPAAAA